MSHSRTESILGHPQDPGHKLKYKHDESSQTQGKRLSETSSEPGVDFEQNCGSLGFEEQT